MNDKNTDLQNSSFEVIIQNDVGLRRNDRVPRKPQPGGWDLTLLRRSHAHSNHRIIIIINCN